MKESDIMHESTGYWVGRDNKNKCYTVFKIGATHSTSDSAYAMTSDGLSIAIARCEYLSKKGNNLMQLKNMTLGQYKESLKYDCARYGFLACPLSDQEIEACYMTGIDLDLAYNIACDVNAGFTFLESYSMALKNKETI